MRRRHSPRFFPVSTRTNAPVRVAFRYANSVGTLN